MPRGPGIPDDLKRLIRETYSENPDMSAKEIRKEVRDKLADPEYRRSIQLKGVYPDNWPSEDAIQQLLKRDREKEIIMGSDPLDKPWSSLSLAKYPVSAEALPVVLKVLLWVLKRQIQIKSLEHMSPPDREKVIQESKLYVIRDKVMPLDPLTIREALWVSRIYMAFKTESGYELAKLWDAATRLASREKMLIMEGEYPSNREGILYYWLEDLELAECFFKNDSSIDEIGNNIASEIVASYKKLKTEEV